jgi:cytoskeleton protein RodZ
MVAQYRQQDRLVIVVNEDSWIDVTDSVGNRLYKNLARAGRKIEVSGNMPFKLHLGNAPGLALELNGEPFAIMNYRDDNSARLTLGSR